MTDPLAKLCRDVPRALEPGIYFDFPRVEYDNIPALSCTVLKKWMKCADFPSRFADWLKDRWTESPTESLLLGAALDCLMLNGNSFDRHFAVVPGDAPARPTTRTRNAKKPAPASLEAIEYWDKFLAGAEGKQILSAGQYAAVVRMQQSIAEAACAAGIFACCRKAVIVAELFGFPCKCEIDLFLEKSEHLWDLKSSCDVAPESAFGRACVDLGYDIQGTLYLLMAQAAGFDKKIFNFVAVENEKPWTPAVYSFMPYDESVLSEEDREKHRRIFEACQIRLARAAGDLVTRLERDSFRDTADYRPIRFPAYAVAQARAESLDYAYEQ
jgi:PDDEXK-like domain of unknown function (DUF3799)